MMTITRAAAAAVLPLCLLAASCSSLGDATPTPVPPTTIASTETDLRALLRGGAGDVEIADTWRAAMWVKLPGHGINDPAFLQPTRSMSAIGG